MRISCASVPATCLLVLDPGSTILPAFPGPVSRGLANPFARHGSRPVRMTPIPWRAHKQSCGKRRRPGECRESSTVRRWSSIPGQWGWCHNNAHRQPWWIRLAVHRCSLSICPEPKPALFPRQCGDFSSLRIRVGNRRPYPFPGWQYSGMQAEFRCCMGRHGQKHRRAFPGCVRSAIPKHR